MPTCRQNNVILASRCRQIEFSMLFCISVFNLWPFKINRMPISLFWNFIIHKPKSDMSAKWRNFSNQDVSKLIFQCCIYISVFNLWPFKKNRMPISLFQNFIIYKPKSDMSEKWRNFSIKMSLNWFFNVTFVFQL